jgi:hypothetical protein
MFISRAYLKTLNESVGKNMRPAHVDRIEYYADLYDRYGVLHDFSIDKKLLSLEHMADELFNGFQQENAFDDCRWLFFTKHGFEWHGDYVSFELYLKERYAINGFVMDVRDCGALCVYYALQLLSDLHVQEQALIVSFENDCITKNYHYMGYLLLSKNMVSQVPFRVRVCEFYDCNNFSEMVVMHQRFINQCCLTEKECRIYSHAAFNFKYESAFLYHVMVEEMGHDAMSGCNKLVIMDFDHVLQKAVFLLLERIYHE